MSLKVVDGIEYEVITPVQSMVKKVLINPMMNYIIPKSLLIYGIRRSSSQILKESLLRPGGWRSMEISYDNKKHSDLIDLLALKFGTFPVSLRNRKKLVAKVICDLIKSYSDKERVNILGIGAGTGANVMCGMVMSGRSDVSAYLIDLDSDAFDYGKELAGKMGLPEDSVQFIEGDAIDIKSHIKVVPNIVKLIGIIEYISDENVKKLLKVACENLCSGGSVVTHSISAIHGVDPFLRRVFNLNLLYRDKEKVIGMLEEAGFTGFKTWDEPLGVYTVITARKK